jgi:hypothetical protein
MENFPNLSPERACEFAKALLWAAIKGIGLGFWWAIKLLWLPFLVILLVWVGFVFVMRWIDEGELPVSFGWVRSFAGWVSKRQHWWSGILIGAAGSGLWALIVKIYQLLTN